MTDSEETYGVVPEKNSNGPHGYGDPNDRTLRRVEVDVCIPMKIRDKSKLEKCTLETEEFTKCCAEASLLMSFKCRKENEALQQCLTSWYYNKEFITECTEEYLAERSEFRRTGVSRSKRSERMQAS